MRLRSVGKLVLISPAGLFSDKAPPPNVAGKTQAEIGRMFVSDPKWVKPYWPANPSPEWQAMRDRESAAAFKSREDAAAVDKALRDGLRDFDRPTLLLWGELDRIVPLATAAEWQEVLPHAELAVIPGGSHLLPDEFPAAVVRLRSFLGA